MTHTDLPTDCKGLTLRYNTTTMTIIDCDATHFVAVLADGSKHCFGRGGFSLADVTKNKI